MLLQGQTGATAVGTQSDKLGQLACTIRLCPSLHIVWKCLSIYLYCVSGTQACCSLTECLFCHGAKFFSAISSLLYCTGIGQSLCCILSHGDIALPKVDNQGKAVWHIAWQATSAQLPLPSTATGQAKPCNALHPLPQHVSAAAVTICVCWHCVCFTAQQ